MRQNASSIRRDDAFVLCRNLDVNFYASFYVIFYASFYASFYLATCEKSALF
jgi:hypothetical protein